jgi:hypothetical protein
MYSVDIGGLLALCVGRRYLRYPVSFRDLHSDFNGVQVGDDIRSAKLDNCGGLGFGV